MRVLKFGGTSVGTAESLLRVKQIIEERKEPVIVVVSALGGITDRLIMTSQRNRSYSPFLQLGRKYQYDSYYHRTLSRLSYGDTRIWSRSRRNCRRCIADIISIANL